MKSVRIHLGILGIQFYIIYVKKIFNIHRWNLAGCDFSKSTIDLENTIPVTNGNMDEKGTMWFEVENKYIRINIKALVANKV